LLKFGPVVDADEISADVLSAIENGTFTQVPFIMGSVTHEGYPFVHLATSSSSSVMYATILAYIFGIDAPKIQYYYPPNVLGDCHVILAQVITDYVFTCPKRNCMESFVKKYEIPVYQYFYDHYLSFDGWGERMQFCAGQVCHGGELPILFGTAILNGNNITQAESSLTKSMIIYWTNFAKTLNPNTPAKPPTIWPTFIENNTYQHLYFGQEGEVIAGKNLRREYCDFFDGIGYDNEIYAGQVFSFTFLVAICISVSNQMYKFYVLPR